MSFFGDLLGYDRNGFDLLGTHEDPHQNCPVCGVAAILHSQKQNAICMSKLFGNKCETVEKAREQL